MLEPAHFNAASAALRFVRADSFTTALLTATAAQLVLLAVMPHPPLTRAVLVAPVFLTLMTTVI